MYPCRPGDHIQTANGSVSLQITLEGARIRLGSSVPMSIQARNASHNQIVIWMSGFWPNHRVIVADTDGIELPLSPMGRERRRRFEETGYRRKNTPLTLQPRGVWTWPVIDIAQLYELRTGSYMVQVVYDETRAPNPSCVASNIVAFEIIAAR